MKNGDARSAVSELSEDARQILAYLKNSDYQAGDYILISELAALFGG